MSQSSFRRIGEGGVIRVSRKEKRDNVSLFVPLNRRR